MKRRVLVLGIDGGTWRILEPAMRAGSMPWLSQACQRGCRGVLESTIPPITPAAWTSFQTGCNPGRHGVYDFTLWNRAKRRLDYVSSRGYSETLWDIAGRAGHRVGVINLPMTYPAWPIDGYMVSGLMTPSLERDWTWPPELAGDLLGAVPDYHIFTFDSTQQGNPHRDPSGFIDLMRGIIDNRTRAALHILAKERLDLFMVHFQATDVVQHVMWGYLDDRHPLYREKIHNLILHRFYQYLDEQFRIIDEAFRAGGGACITWMVSDHGFQSHFHRFQFGNWLVNEGYMRVRRRSRRFSKIKEILASTRLLGLNSFLQKTPLRKTDWWKKVQIVLQESIFEMDWEGSRVYTFSRSSDGFVFLLENDASKRAALERELTDRLMALRNPRTHQPILRRILRKEEIYPGPMQESMPDLILIPAAGYSVSGDMNPFQNDLLLPIRKGKDFHLGMHHPDGIVAAFGDPVKAGRRIAGARLIDLAPTILACLGVDIPDTMDGRVIQDMFERHISWNRAVPCSRGSDRSADSSVYSQQDIQSIEDRLRSLGYIE